MLTDLPVFAVCGWSGSGKTTLLRGVVRHLAAQGLRIAVLKHDVHRLDVDRPGKDSDVLFRAGADVCLQGRTERFCRFHPDGRRGVEDDLRDLARDHDLVLVEGFKHTPLPKIWLLSDGEDAPPRDVGDVVAVLPRGVNRVPPALALIQAWLPGQWVRTPVQGCVLIGGRSRRMGRPKHLLKKDGLTWLERTVVHLQRHCRRVVIVGAGRVPETLSGLVRLPDVSDAEGPLSGLLAAMRWDPHVSWLVSACDLPDLTPDALRWLLATRAPGVWATLPRLRDGGRVEPLLAHYDVRARTLLERLAAAGNPKLATLDGLPHVITPAPPSGLRAAWRNVNTPAAAGALIA